MSELSKAARDLLREAGKQHAPSERELANLTAAVSAKLGVPLDPSSIMPASQPGVAALAKLGKLALLKTAGVSVMVGALVITSWATREAPRPAAPPAVQVLREPEPAQVEQVEAPAPLITPPAPRRRARKSAPMERPHVEAPQAAPAPDQLANEILLIRAARSLLAKGEARAALRKLDEHEASFAAGTLREERLKLRMLVLSALDDD